MAPPIVQGIDKVITINDTIDVADLFTVIDPENDPITQYEFTDESGNAITGRFELNGVGQNNGTTLTIGAAQLGNLLYVGGSSVSKEKIFVRAFDGGFWSSLVGLTVYTARSNDTAPVIVAEDFSVLSPELMLASEFIEAYDPDGWPVTTYYIRDRKVGAGKFWLDGSFKAEGTVFTVNADEFERLAYQGAGDFATEQVDIWVHDGGELSPRTTITANTRPNVNRPAVFYKEIAVPVAGQLDLFPLLEYTDPDGNSIKRMRIRDASPQEFSSYVSVNGNVREPQVWINVNANQFGSIKLGGATRQHSSLLRVQMYDGRHWSKIQSLRINSVERPKLISDEFVVKEQLDSVPLSEVFDKTGTGPTPQSYEIYDGNDGFTSGRFQIGTTQFAAKQIHNISANQFNNMVFRTAAYGARQMDDIYVRADNGTFKNIWKRVEVSTEPNYAELMFRQDGPNYNDWLDWNTIGGQDPYEVTYSFMQTRDYDPGVEAFEPDVPVDGFAPFTTLQRIAIREIMADMETMSNIKFVEVADNQTDELARKGGLIRIGNFVDPDDDAPGSITLEPDHTITTPAGGDLWINAAKFDLSDISRGTGSFYTMMFNMARAIGATNPGVFPGQQNWSNFTVQSSPISRFFVHGGFEVPTNYSLYDIYTFQTLYGANFNGNAGDDVYDIANWKGGNPDLVSTIWDGNGTDTISAEGAIVPAFIDLHEGAFSTIGTVAENVNIAWNTKIENAIGSDHADTIVGNHYVNNLNGGLGDDDITSGSGDDIMTGGAGHDTLRYHIADGNDVIDEMRLGGRDTAVLESFPSLDDFSGDLAFRTGGQFNRDLIVDLVLDGGESQGSLTVRNMRWGGSRVETLDFNGTRIDLASIYSQATPTNQSYEILATSTASGFLAQPV